MITIEIVRKSDDTVLDVVTGDDREQVEAEANRRRPAGTYLRRLVPPRKRQESASVPDRMTTTTAEILTTSWLKTFRLEYMDDNVVWIRLYRDGKPDLVFNLSAAEKITGTHYED